MCQLEDGGAFETSDIEFTGVRLTVIAENSCGTASDTASATLPVTLAPSITLSVDDNDKVCDDTDDEAIAVFGYTAYHKVVSINDFTVLAPSGCSKQLRGKVDGVGVSQDSAAAEPLTEQGFHHGSFIHVQVAAVHVHGISTDHCFPLALVHLSP